ncbi:phage portal protein [Aerococcus urinae]|uniref:phage portal protein n=1 Tax=Aerococcus urinae TaxID=1376 RepID=UPI002551B965|nr:phage portal protein [Aerococcus urinae]MDK6688318.1 phage portal protein [Aerococcus urinae]
MANTTFDEEYFSEEGVYVPKSYRFERDVDDVDQLDDDRLDVYEFDTDANQHYLYTTMSDLLDNLDDLKKMIEDFTKNQRERLQVLEDYSEGRNYAIRHGRRRQDKRKADYRIAHNWGGYLSTFVTGFILGKPVTVEYSGDEGDLDSEELSNITDNNDLDSLNYELAYDASRYGRGYELHWRGEDNLDYITQVDPKSIFVIRSHLGKQPIIGAVYLPTFMDKTYPTVYTDTEIITYKPYEGADVILEEDHRTKHAYKIVPVVEWWNNRYRSGDWESETSTIDAYDAAQSDTANYMSDLNDATLVLKVDDMDSLGGKAGLRAMQDSNTFVLENGADASGRQTQGSAEYIYKQYDVDGTEAYKTRLLNDLFKLTKIPNLDDERFGTQSGISIKYKLIALQQLQATKENYYKKALRRRYQLIENVHESANDKPLKATLLDFTFHPNFPEDVWSEIEAYINAGGELSQATLRELASFTDNDTEEERLEAERLSPNATDAEKAFFSGKLGDDNLEDHEPGA